MCCLQAEAWSRDRAVRSPNRLHHQKAAPMSASPLFTTTSLRQSMPFSAAFQDLTSTPGPHYAPGSFMALLMSNSPLSPAPASPAVPAPSPVAAHGLSPDLEDVMRTLLSPAKFPPTPLSTKRAQDAIAQAALSPDSRFLEDWLLCPESIPTPSPSAVAMMFDGIPITSNPRPMSAVPYNASPKSASRVSTDFFIRLTCRVKALPLSMQSVLAEPFCLAVVFGSRAALCRALYSDGKDPALFV